MPSQFDEWVARITHDDDDDTGVLAPGALEFFHEVFDEHGPVAAPELTARWHEREFALARDAVLLFAGDMQRTTGISPQRIELYRNDDGVLVAAFDGGCTAPPMLALRPPETICEVAENLRDHVVEEVWTVWPVCPEHDRGLAAQPIDGVASWVCPDGGHVVAAIGRLGAGPSDPT